MITDNDQKQLLYKIYYFQEVMKSSYADANEAYEVLEKHEDDSKYYISLGYLAMSQQSFTEITVCVLEKWSGSLRNRKLLHGL
ncbi:hypothetical protein [Paenibacillus polymyxa]|uniref:hypothetical protein n=1 Tax=Paenibacillus polymyxa TaxID=1406 RepID=UPI00234AC7C4|nr:hypothetical protein [Paenibacillus polymyxa]WCM59216.1 hypothetical protein OYT09_14360 [Paenibacillus polymyxa]